MHHLSVHYLAMIVCVLPEAACSIVRENSNLAAAAESADLSDAADDLRCLGLPVGLALLGGELPVDDILIVRLRICTRGRGPADAPPLTGIG